MANGGPYLQKMLRFHWSFSFFRGLVRYMWKFYLFVVAVKKFSLMSNSTFLCLALCWDSLNISSLSSDSLLSSAVRVCWRDIPRLKKNELIFSYFVSCVLAVCIFLLSLLLELHASSSQQLQFIPMHFSLCHILKHGTLSERPTCSWDPLLQGERHTHQPRRLSLSEVWVSAPWASLLNI